MSYARRVSDAAQRIIPILQKLEVEERYLRFDGRVELPRRITAPTQSDSKFQAEQALGDWAEDTLRAAINEKAAGLMAIPYGDNSKIFAEDEGFREAYRNGIVETFTYGKKADLLLVPNEQDFPANLTQMARDDAAPFVARSIGALEVRSSRLSAAIYRDYQKARLAQKRKPTYMEPNFTLKVEDLVKVFLWVHLNDKPQAYIQVFFDEVHAMGFADMLEYIAADRKLVVDKHDRSAKTTIMIPISNGRLVGEVVQQPGFSVVHNTLQSGRHDIFARPDGGKIDVDVRQIPAALE